MPLIPTLWKPRYENSELKMNLISIAKLSLKEINKDKKIIDRRMTLKIGLNVQKSTKH